MTSLAEVVRTLDPDTPRSPVEIADQLRCARDVVVQHLKRAEGYGDCRATPGGWLLLEKPARAARAKAPTVVTVEEIGMPEFAPAIASEPVDYFGMVIADLRARRDGIDRAIAALEALR